MTLSGAQIAGAAGGPTVAFSPPAGELSTLFDWFVSADRLCVIARDPAMKPQDCDVGFSHVLGHLSDRYLTVVSPEAGKNYLELFEADRSRVRTRSIQ